MIINMNEHAVRTQTKFPPSSSNAFVSYVVIFNEYSRRVEWFMPVLTRLDHERNVGEQLLPFRRAVVHHEHCTELVTTPFFLHLQT